ncbi:MAG TPA: hypothetical protein VJ063_01900, partial [Verrucomicrobiae bacterium]|nr:hypothetical protein [Verrucomicrobiae bacterium]
MGAQRTWDGGGADWDWRTSLNWDGSIIRPNDIDQGDTLIFPAGPTKLINTNDFGPNTNFTALIYSGPGYTSYGNQIGLSNGISVTHGSGISGIYLPVLLRDDQSFTVSSASATLILGGDINIGLRTLTFDGPGNFLTAGEIINTRFGGGRNSVVKTGTGRLTIFQPTDHDVPTIVNGGILAIEQRMTNSPVTVNAGGTVRGSSRLGALTANSGGVVQPGGNTPNALECYGDLNLAPGSIFRVRLNGTSAGTSYDQLQVNGTVTLGGSLEVTTGFLPAVGDTFTIIDNDGTDDVVGTFAGLPEGAEFTMNGRPFKISYGARFGGPFGRGNDVTIEAIPAVAVWDGGGNLNKFWSEPLNWVGDIAPSSGDDVQFTASGSLLRTVNDLPATHPIGTIILISGDHRIEGNLPQLNGGIQINPGLNDTNRIPRKIEITAPILLGANQSLRMNYTNSFLDLKGAVDLGDNDLTVYTESISGLGSTAYSQINIFGGITGGGTLIKNGPGNVSLLSPSTCAHTIVNGGTFRMDRSSSSSAPITGSVTVNAGTFDVGDEVGSNVTVNAGGQLTGIGSSIGGNVEINGGTFRPWEPIYSYRLIEGNLRMINGANYEVTTRDTEYGPNATGAAVGGTVELAGCTLNLIVNATFLPGQAVALVSYPQNARTGTFAGLPQGTRFMAGGHAFIIDYNPWSVAAIADPPYVWTGGGIGSRWNTAANWSWNYAPSSGTPLVFPSGVPKVNVTNDLTAGISMYALTFGSSYSVYGNALSISAYVSNSITSGQTLVQADLNFQQNNFPATVEGASVLRLDGLLSGGSVRKFGTGTLRLGGSADNTFVGAEIWAGELELGKSGANAVNGTVRIGDGTNSATLSLLSDDQIADSADVTVNAPARFVLNNYVDMIDGLSGDGEIVLNAPFQT